MVWGLGIFFSLAVGTGDFFGGYLSRRSQALTVVITFLGIGAIVATALLFVIPSDFIGRDVGYGALGGLTVGFALLCLYHGLSVSSAAVVSPVTAVLTALIPVSWDIATGAELTALVIAGGAVALVGLVLTTVSPELMDRVRVGVQWGVAAGMCFGVSLTLIGQTSEASGMWATVAQRVVAMLLLLVIAVARSIPLWVGRDQQVKAWIGGTLGGFGVAAFVAGAQRGSLSEITITSSMFPVVTAVLSARFDHHPMRWWQMIGIGIAVTGVVMIGIG